MLKLLIIFNIIFLFSNRTLFFCFLFNVWKLLFNLRAFIFVIAIVFVLIFLILFKRFLFVVLILILSSLCLLSYWFWFVSIFMSFLNTIWSLLGTTSLFVFIMIFMLIFMWFFMFMHWLWWAIPRVMSFSIWFLRRWAGLMSSFRFMRLFHFN